MKHDRKDSVGCVLMAAGNASRFGENKLTAVIDGRTMIRRAMDAIPVDRLASVCVVTQYGAVETLAGEYGFFCVRNTHPEWGQSYSVRLGTEALKGSCDAILYMVADQPYLQRESVADLVERTFPHLDGKVLINSIGTTIGSHTGPGTVALFFWGDERKE